MMKWSILFGTSAGSYAFWWLGESVLGLGLGWTYTLSAVGSLLGVYVGWRVARQFGA